MSCVDVMYQPYASYLPYQRPGPPASSSMGMDPFKKFSMPRMHEPGLVDHGGGGSSSYSSSVSSTGAPSSQSNNHSHYHHHHGGSPSGGSSSSSSAAVTAGTLIPKEEGEVDREPRPHSTEYISATCVLLTYFAGDIASNVEDHFTRALSQASSFSSGTSDGNKTSSWKGSSPMSQRNFPPSFWNSNYQPPPSTSSISAAQHYQDLTTGFSTDPYSHMASSLHTMASLQDPWGRYPLSSQTHGAYNPHAAMHDFAYSSMHAAATGSSRFNAAAHYSSLLPATRLGSMSSMSSMSQCDPLSKHSTDTSPWSSRYHHTDALGANLAATHHTSHLNAAAAAAAASGLGGKWY